MKKKKTNTWILQLLICMGVFAGLMAYAKSADVTKAPTENKKTESIYLTNLSEKQAGDVLKREQVDWNHLSWYFTVQEIDASLLKRMQGKSYQDNPDISPEGLRYLKVLHYNYDHQVQVGEIVVNESIASDVKQIFMELFENGYEINSMYLVDRYYLDGDDGDQADYNSVNNNNTSGFHYRKVADTDVLSAHAYGLAIDINPLENPSMVQNADGTYSNKYLNLQDYSDRSQLKKHMITENDLCYQLFVQHGFIWGGQWDGPADYQHFEIAWEE